MIIILVLALGVVAVLAGGVVIAKMPTRGKKIGKYGNPKKALVVIDIQEDYTGTTAKPSSRYKNSDKFIATVNGVIKEAPENNMVVVYTKQEFDDFQGRMLSKIFLDGVAIKGEPGTEIDKRISIVSDNIFAKSRGDSFSNVKFEAFLIKNQVDELYLAGLDAQYCIYDTARGALNRGYKVNIITDGILLGAKEKWNSLMEKYKKNGIRLISSNELP
jgi:nicotinamidase/pyrazinamidase